VAIDAPHELAALLEAAISSGAPREEVTERPLDGVDIVSEILAATTR